MSNEYILIKTDKQFADVYEHVRNALLGFDKRLGESGHERSGLNIGDGEYYSFQDPDKLKVYLIRNVVDADLFDPSWTYYVKLKRMEFEDSKYISLKEKIKETLDLIGVTKITTEFD